MKEKNKIFHIIITIGLISALVFVVSFFEDLPLLVRYISLGIFASDVGVFVMYIVNIRNSNKIMILENKHKYWNNISYRVKKAGETAFNKLPIAIIVYSNKHLVEWANAYAKEIFLSPLVDRNLENINIELSKNLRIMTDFDIIIYGKVFTCKVLPEENVLYLIDKTTEVETKERYNSRMLAIGVLELDNLHEALETYDAQEKAKQLSNLMSILGEWSDNFDIYLRGYSEEKYLLIMDRSQLEELISNNFEIIETIEQYTAKEELRVTASIGIACEDLKAIDLIEVAVEQLTLASNRGGNQCVIKLDDKISYFGARTNSAELRSPVYVRVKTEMLVDLLKTADRVFIMSHTNMDADAFGSCLAAYKLAEAVGKDVKIVFDEDLIDATINNVYNIIKKEYINVLDYLITPKEALNKISENTLLIIVDTQYQALLLNEKVYKKAKKIAILDHHRRSEQAITNYNYLYAQTSASSSVELVAEMFEYMGTDIVMSSVEATWMLMGIIVDTNNLMYRVSYRTFNVLAMLQKHGGEIAKAQRFLRDDIDEYSKRVNILNDMQIIDNKYGVALCDNEIYPRAFLAKIADSIISVDKIKAAFCIGRIAADEIGISARSLDEVNVQVIMEQLGGGGHFNNAATQIKDSTIPEVREMLLSNLDKIEQGGISTMKIILIKDVKGKGKAGEVVDIPAGHANFLVRSSQAVLATVENIKQLEKKQEEEKQQEEKHLEEMKELKEKIDNLSVKIGVKVGHEGKLFGTVSTKQIADEYKKQNNITIDKRKLIVEEDIAALGTYKIPLQLDKQVTATITLFVVES